MNLTEDAATALASKLAELELTDGEAAVLAAILNRADLADDDVQGFFAPLKPAEFVRISTAQDIVPRLLAGSGFTRDSHGVWKAPAGTDADISA